MPVKIVKFDVQKEEPIRTKEGFCIEVRAQPGAGGGHDHALTRGRRCGRTLEPRALRDQSLVNEPGELLGQISDTDPTRDFVGYYGNKEVRWLKKTRVQACDVQGPGWPRGANLGAGYATGAAAGGALASAGHAEEGADGRLPEGRQVVPHGRPAASRRVRFLLLCGPHRRHVPYATVPRGLADSGGGRRDAHGRPWALSFEEGGGESGWKGENVSTNEVAEALSGFPGIQEANVYGVEIPGKVRAPWGWPRAGCLHG